MKNTKENSIKKSLLTRTNKYFTLLEILVSFALLLIAAGAVGWKMYGLLEKRRFHADLEQFKSRIQTVHKMAISMQADWEGVLQLEGKKWTFQASCLDPPKSRAFSPIPLHLGEVHFNGETQESYPFLFFSSGEIRPIGEFHFRRQPDEEMEVLELLHLLGKEEGDGIRKLGPVHPDEA